MSGVIIPYLVTLFTYLAKAIRGIVDWISVKFNFPLLSDLLIGILSIYLSYRLILFLFKKTSWILIIIIALLLIILFGGLGL